MKRTYSVLIAVCALLMSGLLLMMPTTVAAASNLAVNGDLELGSANSWVLENAYVDNSVKYQGNYSLKLTATGAYVGAAYKTIPVGKGADVTISFYYRYASTPSSTKTYRLYVYKGANTYIGAYNVEGVLKASNTTAWKKVTVTLNSGDYSDIYLKFSPGESGSSACYIDNLVVTTTGGAQDRVVPYLTSFGTRYNRPDTQEHNLIKNGGFESADNASWNVSGFVQGGMQVIADSTAPEGTHSLYFAGGSSMANHYFPVTVKPYTDYTFSAWVKSPRLSGSNRATATFGVVDPDTDSFLVYEKYNGDGNGSASLSTPDRQLMATSPDGEWHLRSVRFYSGTANVVYIAVRGAGSQLYLDDIALYANAYGKEYISPLRSETIGAQTYSGTVYCADENSLFPYPHMTGKTARDYWSDNPAWRNGFLSFAEVEDSHDYVLKYTASANTMRKLCYIDWIDVQPNTDYILTVDVQRLVAGGGKIMLLDDNIMSPAEFYSIPFSSTDDDWKTYAITFNTGVYSRIGFGIVDGGGQVYIDKTRMFKASDAIAEEPEDQEHPAVFPTGGKTATMDTGVFAPANVMVNGDFELGNTTGWHIYQSSAISQTAARIGDFGVRLHGDGSAAMMMEQYNIPVQRDERYMFVFWHKVISGGYRWKLVGQQSGRVFASGTTGVSNWNMDMVEINVGSDKALQFVVYGADNLYTADVLMDDFSLIQVSGGAPVGVGFRMELPAFGAAVDETHKGYLNNATVDVFGIDKRYPLKKVGCVVTNDPVVGTDNDLLTLQGAGGGSSVVDVPAVYLCDVTETVVAYTVRVVNIPYAKRDAFIYARPYYVYDDNGAEVVLYGDMVCRSYNNANGTAVMPLS